MALKDILAISGKPGLYKFLSQGRNGIIVESLSDNKRVHAPATAKISALEDIAIFTDEEEVPLQEVFKKIYEKEDGGKTIDHKSKPEELKNYMADVLPTYDREKVYVSDLKKLYNWYNILHDLDMLSFEEEEEEEEKEEETNDGSPKNETATDDATGGAESEDDQEGEAPPEK
jgi:hypothetical protein